MEVEYIAFADRSARSQYIASRFKDYLSGKVLDVGCDKAILKKLLPGIIYTGIDIGGTPDITINLEEITGLPFDNRAFDCVVCSDVLEHLDNLHFIFEEIIRVSSRYVIISLPNNWTNARKPLERGRGSFDKYGLPAEKPADRHKWFFNMSEAKNFIEQQLRENNISIKELFATEKPRPLPVRILRRIKYLSHEKYLNRYGHTLWVVLEKIA